MRYSLKAVAMNIEDFRGIALSLEGVEEKSHMGSPDFRVGGRIFATLASQKQGYGNLMLTPEQQAAFVEELPDVFLPVSGGWGKNGVSASRYNEMPMAARCTAWKHRVEQNTKSGRPKTRVKR